MNFTAWMSSFILVPYFLQTAFRIFKMKDGNILLERQQLFIIVEVLRVF